MRATSGRRKLEGEDLPEMEEWGGNREGRHRCSSCRAEVKTRGLDLGEKDSYFLLLIGKHLKEESEMKCENMHSLTLQDFLISYWA